MSELRKQFDYYVANQDALVKKYNGKFVVIAGEAVVGNFDTEMDALRFASGKYEAGTFMIQLVAPGEQNYSQTFFSRASI
jgi:hypothetical protein